MEVFFMKKRELKKIAIQQASKSMIQQAKYSVGISYWLDAQVKIINHKKILVVNVYEQENLTAEKTQPICRIFQTKQDYITQFFDNNSMSWKTGGVENLLSCSQYHANYVCCNSNTEKTMQHFFGYMEKKYTNAYALLCLVQEQIRLQRLQKKHKQIKQRIDIKMKEVKSVPKDFTKWVDKTALAHSRYIYYEYSRKKEMQGYCTYCQTDVAVIGAKHRKTGICPNCGKQVVFLATGKAKYITDRGSAALFQKIQNSFVVRYFSITKIYGSHYKNPEINIYEDRRDFYEDEQTLFYEWRNFKQTGEYRWCEGCQQYYFTNAAVYTKNLYSILSSTKYQYCNIAQFAERYEGADVFVYKYLSEYCKQPMLEYFVKAKLYRMVHEMTSSLWDYYNINWDIKAKSLPALLQILKQVFPIVQQLDMSFEQLKLYKKMLKANLPQDAETFIKFEKQYGNFASYVFDILQFTTLHKIERYCEKQQSKYNMSTILMLWCDYLKFCVELGYDMKNTFVLFPKDLKKAHDTVYQDVEKIRQEKKKQEFLEDNQKAQKLLKQYQEQFCWSDNQFIVLVPQDLFAIKEEGNKLHHCVGTYTHDVAMGTSVILFLRNVVEPEKSLYTMEIKDNQIKQCYGFGNKEISEETKDFLKKYKKVILQNQKQVV